MMVKIQDSSSGDEAQIDGNRNILYFDLFQNEISSQIAPDSEIQRRYGRLRIVTPTKHGDERQALVMRGLRVENSSIWCRSA
jgi:hypothetical protein